MILLFVSYRRSDSKSFAHRLYDRLRRAYGKSVFMDVSDIDPGEDFPKVIEARLSTCKVLVAVIGNTWLTCTDPSGARRLDAPDDYVRLEVAKALAASDILVLPVLVNGAAMPAAADLPADLRALATRNAIAIDDDRFDTDVVKLLETVNTRVPRRSRLPLLAGAVLLLAAVAGAGVWLYQRLDPGEGVRLVPDVRLYTALPQQAGSVGMRYALQVELDGHRATLPDLTKGIVYTAAERADLDKLQSRQDDAALHREVMQHYKDVDQPDAIVAELLRSVLLLPVARSKPGARVRVQVNKSPESPAPSTPWFVCEFVLGKGGQTFFLSPGSDGCHPVAP